ncbi:hypothetical protein IP86_02730 [Rhodopseudomonas sp. AAP120]|uniref:Uncharacterized protein n=1 Tax=Rhodopseudomonas palustris (strain BisB5) TaxID=316057 RepID=Q138U8_RHOPS|nr:MULTISPECIES: hypothetical protein [Rhodopseudomonas]ABE39391.1 hypothetical protein RPD_2156 [Rhodopseudomonas palustris BisB5]ACF00829.1 hypothetical protein Rpal_2311 [Rhodopseudomonas palustris TIE-1]KPG01746.1 hypothetical protein IP86_02730 [Rhodopseudomonas sp. AAP120]
MRVGGPHTSFDTTSFGLGAAVGSLTIAGALIDGVMRYRLAQRQHAERAWRRWNARNLRTALELSEALRARDHERAKTATAEADGLRRCNARLTRDLAIARAESRQ